MLKALAQHPGAGQCSRALLLSCFSRHDPSVWNYCQQGGQENQSDHQKQALIEQQNIPQCQETGAELGIRAGIQGIRAGDQSWGSTGRSSNIMKDRVSLKEKPLGFRLLGSFPHARVVLGVPPVLGTGSCSHLWYLGCRGAHVQPRDDSLDSGAICSREQHGGNPSSFCFS